MGYPPPEPDLDTDPEADDDGPDTAPEDGDAPPAPKAHVDKLIGRTFGTYVTTALLGKGGMGAVYKAAHPVIKSEVAIKVLHPTYASNKKVVDRFFNEARAVNLIGHDNILKILDLNVTDDGLHYFVMELLQGRSLQELLQDGESVPLSTTGPILLQICEALQAAHNRQIVHRDLKPENIFLIERQGRGNFVKVVDFGIAKLADQDMSIGAPGTQTGVVMGTPPYMSPEQAGGKSNRIDGRSDIYSLGVIMFQLATGQLPFPCATFGEALIGHLRTPPPDPRSVNPDIPPNYATIILRTLEKSPDGRQQSMTGLRSEILGCMRELGISADRPVALSNAAPAPRRGAPRAAAEANPPTEFLGGRGASKPPPPAQLKRLLPPEVRPQRAKDLKTEGGTEILGHPPPELPQPKPSPRGPPTEAAFDAAKGTVLLNSALETAVIQPKRVRPVEEPIKVPPPRWLILTAVITIGAVLATTLFIYFSEPERARRRHRSLTGPALVMTHIPVTASDANTHLPLQGASFDASWAGGNDGADLPAELVVPQGTLVRLHFSAPGYAPLDKELRAEATTREIAVELRPGGGAARTVARPRRSGKQAAADPAPARPAPARAAPVPDEPARDRVDPDLIPVDPSALENGPSTPAPQQ